MAIYVSIATIPGREESLSNALLSLALQTVRPKHVYVCVCEKYDRVPGKVDLDKVFTPMLRRCAKLYNLEISVVFSPDFGSCTKALGSQAYISDGFVLLMDDDVYYKPHIIEEFFKVADTPGAYSFHVQVENDRINVRSGKGVDGFMIHSTYLRGLREHYDRLIADEPMWKFQDDLLISLHLWEQKITIKDLRPFAGYCAYVMVASVDENNQMHIDCDYNYIYEKLAASYKRLYN